MALRVLSGIIINEDGPVEGSVEIRFNPHEVISTPMAVEVERMVTVGADGDFTDVPAEHVALRELDFRILALVGGHIRNFINTTTTQDQITVSWRKGTRTIGIAHEISYMIIGDVGSGSDSYGNGGDGGNGDPIRPTGVIVDPTPDLGVRSPVVPDEDSADN